MTPNQGETIDQFCTGLKQKANHCEGRVFPGDMKMHVTLGRVPDISLLIHS